MIVDTWQRHEAIQPNFYPFFFRKREKYVLKQLCIKAFTCFKTMHLLDINFELKLKILVLFLMIYLIFYDLGSVDYSYKLSSTREWSSFITFYGNAGYTICTQLIFLWMQSFYIFIFCKCFLFMYMNENRISGCNRSSSRSSWRCWGNFFCFSHTHCK